MSMRSPSRRPVSSLARPGLISPTTLVLEKKLAVACWHPLEDLGDQILGYKRVIGLEARLDLIRMSRATLLLQGDCRQANAGRPALGPLDQCLRRGLGCLDTMTLEQGAGLSASEGESVVADLRHGSFQPIAVQREATGRIA